MNTDSIKGYKNRKDTWGGQKDSNPITDEQACETGDRLSQTCGENCRQTEIFSVRVINGIKLSVQHCRRVALPTPKKLQKHHHQITALPPTLSFSTKIMGYRVHPVEAHPPHDLLQVGNLVCNKSLTTQ